MTMPASLIVVNPRFDAVWPFAADHLHRLWAAQGPVTFLRLPPGDLRPLGEAVAEAERIERLVVLGVPLTDRCARRFTHLREAAFEHTPLPRVAREYFEELGVKIRRQPTEGYWAQSVAECALALTLGSLRRIPQLHRQIILSPEPWTYNPPDGVGKPGQRGQQFGDDTRFASGTLAGKRVRIVGMGNIGSHYASFCRAIGADVAAWDPVAPEPCFHRSGAKQQYRLETLVRDAEVFAPMLPLMKETQEIVAREHINALPAGCLVVLVTRAGIVDMEALRRRVLADELSLAADVFDVEPLAMDDPLLGRHNVVHTPHLAGRTKEANFAWAQKLVEQFDPAAVK
ncbi:MAG: hydroxyacid dehydrogenase [Planctomycetota bacterium]|nr:hydroxyacid dehydrogenase [Planctomycetota bacterium]